MTEIGKVFQADNLEVLLGLGDESIDLIYIDPPFNTGERQQRDSLRTLQDPNGDRNGFGGRRYRSERLSRISYADSFTDFAAFMEPRLEEAHRVLKPTGSIYVHLDYREVHRVRFLMDDLFGVRNLVNEIIWAFDYGGRPKDRWPNKHNTILFYAKDDARRFFDLEACDRIAYMSPELVGAEKTERGKIPTDVWWHTIVPTNGKEKTGYPTQKPLGILKRIVQCSCPIGGTVLDFFAGSGTTGLAALLLKRKFVLVDENPAAIATMQSRFAFTESIIEWNLPKVTAPTSVQN